jgi:hypothetical protein
VAGGKVLVHGAQTTVIKSGGFKFKMGYKYAKMDKRFWLCNATAELDEQW